MNDLPARFVLNWILEEELLLRLLMSPAELSPDRLYIETAI